jgi:hypothetical protein
MGKHCGLQKGEYSRQQRRRLSADSAKMVASVRRIAYASTPAALAAKASMARRSSEQQ